MEGPAGVRKDRGSETGGGRESERESGRKGHSCRGLMPRVEELELEPRNVPQRPLKREVKREGVQGKTRARASDVSCTAQSLRMFVGVEEGAVFHPCQSYPLSQSAPTTSTSTHSSSGTLAVISPSSQDISPRRSSLPAFCVTFFVL